MEAKHWWKLRTVDPLLGPMLNSLIIRNYLTAQKYAFGRKDLLPRLEYLSNRAQRGLISYYGRPVAELRKFCTDRKIEDFKGMKKAGLIKVLEDEDEWSQFPRFLDLPAELRVLIYEFSFDVMIGDSYRETNALFEIRPPPVTSVCKLLRQESRPLFYSPARLEIWLFIKSNSDVQNFFIGDLATMFFSKAPKSVLETTNKLRIHIGGRYNHNGGQWIQSKYDWEIDLQTAKLPYKLKQVPNTLLDSPRESRHEEIEKRLQAMLGAMFGNESRGGVKLRRSDLEVIEKTFRNPQTYLQDP